MNRKIRYRWRGWLLGSMIMMFNLGSCTVGTQPKDTSVQLNTVSGPSQPTEDLATESRSVAVNKLGFHVQGWT
jgi:hypothetical protein